MILYGEFLLAPWPFREGIDDAGAAGFQPGMERDQILGLDIERDGRLRAQSIPDRRVVVVP